MDKLNRTAIQFGGPDMFSVISRTADQQQRLNNRIQRATFTSDGETPKLYV